MRFRVWVLALILTGIIGITASSALTSVELSRSVTFDVTGDSDRNSVIVIENLSNNDGFMDEDKNGVVSFHLNNEGGYNSNALFKSDLFQVTNNSDKSVYVTIDEIDGVTLIGVAELKSGESGQFYFLIDTTDIKKLESTQLRITT